MSINVVDFKVILYFLLHIVHASYQNILGILNSGCIQTVFIIHDQNEPYPIMNALRERPYILIWPYTPMSIRNIHYNAEHKETAKK